jgi:hypothetical protein
LPAKAFTTPDAFDRSILVRDDEAGGREQLRLEPSIVLNLGVAERKSGRRAPFGTAPRSPRLTRIETFDAPLAGQFPGRGGYNGRGQPTWRCESADDDVLPRDGGGQ